MFNTSRFSYRFIPLLLVIPLAFVAGSSWAQSPRLLLVGDSWAAQQWEDGSHQRVLNQNGFGNFEVRGANTTTSGSTAAEWTQPDQLQRIADALTAEPTIDTVQLTLGGNDFLGGWSTNLSDQESMNLQMEILDDLIIITEFILQQRADIEILLSFYDYPNFVDTLGGVTGFLFCAPLHNDLGQPAPLEINTAATEFIDVYQQLDSDPRIHFVNHAGLMQFSFGFPDQNIQPGDLPPPGDLSLPSPATSLRTNISSNDDCFHLSAEGYDILVENLFDQYLMVRLDTLFKSGFE